jgi:hypothetical protein
MLGCRSWSGLCCVAGRRLRLPAAVTGGGEGGGSSWETGNACTRHTVAMIGEVGAGSARCSGGIYCASTGQCVGFSVACVVSTCVCVSMLVGGGDVCGWGERSGEGESDSVLSESPASALYVVVLGVVAPVAAAGSCWSEGCVWVGVVAGGCLGSAGSCCMVWVLCVVALGAVQVVVAVTGSAGGEGVVLVVR